MFMKLWEPFVISYNRTWNYVECVMPKGIRHLHPHGNYIVEIKTGENPKNLVADEVYDVLIDEAPLCDREVAEQCMGRVLHSGGKVFMVGTPLPIRDLMVQPWFKEVVIESAQKGDPDYAMVFGKTADAPPFKTPEGARRLAAYRKRLGPERAAMALDGQHIQVASLVFPEFQYNRHVCDTFEIDPNVTVVAGVDPGYGSDPMAVVWFADLGDRFVAIDELREVNVAPSKVAEKVKMSRYHDQTDVYFVDPSAAATTQEFMVAGIPVMHAERNYELTYGKLKDLIRQESRSGVPRFQIQAHCHNTIREFEKCCIPSGGLRRLKNNHQIDAAFYGLGTYAFGPTRRTVKAVDPEMERWKKYDPRWIPPSIHRKLYGNVDGYVFPLLNHEKPRNPLTPDWDPITDFSHA